MTKDERQHEHELILKEISQIKLLDSFTKEVDHESTTKLRAKLMDTELKGYLAREKGYESFERLIHMAETRNSGQIERVAKFIGACWDDHGFCPCDLRSLDQQIGDDMLAVLDAIRYGRIAVYEMADNATSRVPALLRLWGLMPEIGTV